MTHKLSSLRSKIQTSIFTEEGLTYYTARCPICADNFEARIETDARLAKITAIGKVTFHLKVKHKDEIENDEKPDA